MPRQVLEELNFQAHAQGMQHLSAMQMAPGVVITVGGSVCAVAHGLVTALALVRSIWLHPKVPEDIPRINKPWLLSFASDRLGSGLGRFRVENFRRIVGNASFVGDNFYSAFVQKRAAYEQMCTCTFMHWCVVVCIRNNTACLLVRLYHTSSTLRCSPATVARGRGSARSTPPKWAT